MSKSGDCEADGVFVKVLEGGFEGLDFGVHVGHGLSEDALVDLVQNSVPE